jgi:hypothetical protein
MLLSELEERVRRVATEPEPAPKDPEPAPEEQEPAPKEKAKVECTKEEVTGETKEYKDSRTD